MRQAHVPSHEKARPTVNIVDMLNCRDVTSKCFCHHYILDSLKLSTIFLAWVHKGNITIMNKKNISRYVYCRKAVILLWCGPTNSRSHFRVNEFKNNLPERVKHIIWPLTCRQRERESKKINVIGSAILNKLTLNSLLRHRAHRQCNDLS